MARIRLIVTDLDGTFWHGHEVIHDRTRRAYDEFLAAGIDVLIATGRRLRAVTRGTQRAGIAGSAVLMSGALGADLDTGREWHRTGFTPEAAERVLAAFRSQGMEPVAYVGRDDLDAVAGAGCSTDPDHLASFGPHVRRDHPDRWGEEGMLVGFGVIGVDDPRLDRVAAAIDGVAHAWLGPDYTYGGRTLMVGPAGVTKVAALEPWVREHGYTTDEILAVGDGSNDVAMLRWAGTSVAVRGGAAAQEGADHLIDGPETGGWADLTEFV